MSRTSFFELVRPHNLIAAYAGGGGVKTAANEDGGIVGPFASGVVGETNSGVGIWEARTNLLAYSQQLDHAQWNKAGTVLPTVLANVALAPDGTMSADTVTWASGGTSTLQRNGVGYTAGQPYTLSWYIKAVSGTATVRLSAYDGASSFTSSDQTVGESWTRISFTFTAGNTTALGGVANITRSTASLACDAYIWGAQLEQGAFPTPYIPTTAAAVTRTADALTLPNIAGALTAPFTLFVEAELPAIDGIERVLLNIMNAAQSQGVRIIRGSSNNMLAYGNPDGVSDRNLGSMTAGTAPGATIQRFALRVRTSEVRVSSQGLLAAAVSTTGWGAFTNISIGYRPSTAYLNGYIRKLRILPDMSDAALTALTAFSSTLTLDFTQ